MVEYEPRPSESEYEGCLTALELFLTEKDELSEKELDEIDEVMRKIGSENTGRRIDIRSAGKKTVRVKYVYQQRLMSKSLENARQRLAPPFGSFEEPTIFIGTEVVNLVEKE